MADGSNLIPSKKISRILGIKRIRMTSYHPASNGMTERFHRQLKVVLRAYPDQQRWSEYGVPLSFPDQMLNPIDITATDLDL